jgi:dUTP pyrophosphatase
MNDWVSKIGFIDSHYTQPSSDIFYLSLPIEIKDRTTEKLPINFIDGISIYNSTDIPLDKPSPENTGIDIRSNEDAVIPAKGWKVVKTGLFVSDISVHLDIQIRSRSGLAAKNGIFVLNSPGTIDASYRGEICVILANHSDKDFVVSKNDRIAQMVIALRITSDISEVSEETYRQSIDNSNRSTGGFGSTGVK